MIYLVHKQSKATLQIPVNNNRWSRKALNRRFPHCYVIDWAQYLFYVKTNHEEYKRRKLKDLERTPRGYYWHSKYLSPRPSNIKDINPYEKYQRQKQKRLSKARSQSPSLETLQAHPGSMETLSGGE